MEVPSSLFPKVQFIPKLLKSTQCVILTTESHIKEGLLTQKPCSNINLLKELTTQHAATIYGTEEYDYEIAYAYLCDDNNDSVRANAIKATNALHSKTCQEANICFQGIAPERICYAIQGVLLTNYDMKFTKEGMTKVIPKVNFICQSTPQMEEMVYLCQAVVDARNYSNQIGSIATPEYFENITRKLFAGMKGVSIEVISGKQLLENNLNLIYSVGRGGNSEPRMINIVYKGNEESKKTYSFVGKGVCFDAGGYNIKSTGGIELMHLDKCGACNVLAAVYWIAKLGLKINVVGGLAMSQNLINDKSYLPSDIIKSYNGATVIIGNTDAEGRLCLVDVMSYIQRKYSPKVMLDLATLTGAIGVALGNDIAGVFTNSKNLVNKVIKLGDELYEPLWEMPIKRFHEDAVKATLADLTNMSNIKGGGACVAAAFIKQFIEKNVNWCHLDIAAPATTNGGTGFGTQILLKYAINKSNKCLKK